MSNLGAGAIYVARVEADIPPLDEIKTTFQNHWARIGLGRALGIADKYYEEDGRYFLPARFRNPAGEDIYPDIDYQIAYLSEPAGRILLQGCLADDPENFTALFSRAAERDDFEYCIAGHWITEDQSVFYIAPITADSRWRPAVAVLPIGCEAVIAHDEPSLPQRRAYLAAAELLLS